MTRSPRFARSPRSPSSPRFPPSSGVARGFNPEAGSRGFACAFTPKSQRPLVRARLTGGALLLLVALLTMACQGPDHLGPCNAQQFAIDSTFHSYADSGLPVAAFALHQVYDSYPDGCSDRVGGLVDLVIISEAFVPLAFGYTLRGYDEKANRDWSYEDQVLRLAPGDSLVVGTIVRSRVRIDVNTRVGFDSVRVVP